MKLTVTTSRKINENLQRREKYRRRSISPDILKILPFCPWSHFTYFVSKLSLQQWTTTHIGVDLCHDFVNIYQIEWERERWDIKLNYISKYHNITLLAWRGQRGVAGLVKRYSEKCWAASTPPPLLAARENWWLSSCEITCRVVTLQ